MEARVDRFPDLPEVPQELVPDRTSARVFGLPVLGSRTPPNAHRDCSSRSLCRRGPSARYFLLSGSSRAGAGGTAPTSSVEALASSRKETQMLGPESKAVPWECVGVREI